MINTLLGIITSTLSSLLNKILIQYITNDHLCLTNLSKLEEEIQDLLKELINHDRSQNSILKKIKLIQQTLKTLIDNNSAILTKSSKLEELINKSLSIIGRSQYYHNNEANLPHSIAVELLEAWGANRDRPYEIIEIVKLKKFFMVNPLKRILLKFAPIPCKILTLINFLYFK